jgi:Cucumopine synthase C-terminal helical bundle domain
MSDIKKFQGDWRDAKAEIERQIERVWLTEPEEIQKIRWGVIDSGAGSGHQSFSVLVHLEAYLMLVGADVMYRFLKVSQYPDVELATLTRMTKEFLSGTFNVFEFMTDLGLTNMHEIGQAYADSMDTLKTKEEYVQLTGAMMTYVVRMHRWIHFIFPWNLGVAFPHRKPAEVASIAAITGTS